MSDLKAQLLRVASTLPKGDPNRRAIAHLFREEEAETALRTAASKMPTVLVQEGGYLGPELGINLAAFLAAFESAHAPRKG